MPPFINDVMESNQESALKNQSRLSRFVFDPENVTDILRNNIIGQEAVIQAMEAMLYMLKADFNDPQRPLGVYLFVGPTGVGKTEIVRVLAQALCGDAKQLCRIDMNTLSQEHFSSALSGSPPGYVGSKDNLSLLDSDKIQGTFSRPGIVLFDEIEKADKNVVRTLLNVLDTATLRLSSGTKEIDFSNSLIFMTSNIGAKEAAELRAQSKSGWQGFLSWLSQKDEATIVHEQITKHFDPEFLNRIDQILHFDHINTEDVEKIADIHLARLEEQLAKKGITLTVESSAKQYLFEQPLRDCNARSIARRLRQQLYPALAKAMIENQAFDQFILYKTNGDLKIDAHKHVTADIS